MRAAGTKRQEELLKDLVVLFLAEGFRNFTLDDLAQRMSCSKTTLYALGHSKEAVVRNVLDHFFRRAGEEVERKTAPERDPAAQIATYLRAVADQLRPASRRFFADIAARPDTRAVYERNTAIAAERIGEMVSAGVREERFRSVDPAFVADMVAAEMARIQSGDVRDRVGLDDAEAYDALASLVLNGISR